MRGRFRNCNVVFDENGKMAIIEKGSEEAHDALEEACADYLKKRHRLKLYKANAKPVKVGKHFIPRATKGLPDRFMILPPSGRLVGIEIKTGQAHPRAAQRERFREFRAAGALVLVIRSLDQFVTEIDALIREEAELAPTPAQVRDKRFLGGD